MRLFVCVWAFFCGFHVNLWTCIHGAMCELRRLLWGRALLGEMERGGLYFCLHMRTSMQVSACHHLCRRDHVDVVAVMKEGKTWWACVCAQWYWFGVVMGCLGITLCGS